MQQRKKTLLPFAVFRSKFPIKTEAEKNKVVPVLCCVTIGAMDTVISSVKSPQLIKAPIASTMGVGFGLYHVNTHNGHLIISLPGQMIPQTKAPHTP